MVRRIARKANYNSVLKPKAPEKDSGVEVVLHNQEDADFRYLGNNPAAIQRRFPADVIEAIKEQRLDSRAEEYLPSVNRKVVKWHDERIIGIRTVWERMDAILHKVDNYEPHAISFIRDKDISTEDDSNIGWFVSWNTPV